MLRLGLGPVRSNSAAVWCGPGRAAGQPPLSNECNILWLNRFICWAHFHRQERKLNSLASEQRQLMLFRTTLDKIKQNCLSCKWRCSHNHVLEERWLVAQCPGQHVHRLQQAVKEEQEMTLRYSQQLLLERKAASVFRIFNGGCYLIKLLLISEASLFIRINRLSQIVRSGIRQRESLVSSFQGIIFFPVLPHSCQPKSNHFTVAVLTLTVMYQVHIWVFSCVQIFYF